MANYPLSLTLGFFAMAFVMIAYFVTKKSLYLLFQSLCIIFLVLSYLFNEQYFPMVGLSIGLVRVLAFFWYEKREKDAPIWISYAVSSATILAYYIVNFVVLKQVQAWDVLCLLASVMYSFIFRIRNLKVVRFTMLVPTTLNITFNIVTHATLFVTLTYVFEMCANLVSIYKYHIKKEKTTPTKSVEKGENE
jgi:hypothetical protein